jgi:putative ABC transport system ATP-binding protein
LVIVPVEANSLFRFFHTDDEEVVALRDVSLRVASGEFIAVMGPSGSGKSTLLACLAGLDRPDGGMVYVNNQPMSRRSEAERARLRARHIGVLLQAGNLMPHLTVDENIRVARALASRRPAVETDMLERLGIAARRTALPGALSGGEAVRAGIAVACANEPDVLLADEPTGEIDSINEAQVITLLREQARRGAAVVAVTHSHSVARAADRVLHLSDGRLSA